MNPFASLRDKTRRPTTTRARPSSYIDAHYSALASDADHHTARPSHARENSRAALLNRAASYRSSARYASDDERDDENDGNAEMDRSNEMATMKDGERKGGDVVGSDARAPRGTIRTAADGKPLTAVQMKQSIVSAALEETGMGRYQWCMCVRFRQSAYRRRADGSLPALQIRALRVRIRARPHVGAGLWARDAPHPAGAGNQRCVMR
jgi:hypothetical protein